MESFDWSSKLGKLLCEVARVSGEQKDLIGMVLLKREMEITR